MIALRVGLLLALSLTIVYAAEAPIPCNDGKGECVKLHLCQDGTINTDGSNLIDIRFNDEDPCEHYLLKCCEIAGLDEEIVEPPNSEIISVPLPTDGNQHKGDDKNVGHGGQEEIKEPEGIKGPGGNQGSNIDQGNYGGSDQSGAGGFSGSSNTHSSSGSSSNANSGSHTHGEGCRLVCQPGQQNGADNGGVKGTGYVSGETLFNSGGTQNSGGLVTYGQHGGTGDTSLNNIGGGTSNNADGQNGGSHGNYGSGQGQGGSLNSGSQNFGQSGVTGTGSTSGSNFENGNGFQGQGGTSNSAIGGSHNSGSTDGSGNTSGASFGNTHELESGNQLQGSQGGSSNSGSSHFGHSGVSGTGSTGGSTYESGKGSQGQGGASNSAIGGSTGSNNSGTTDASGSTSGASIGNGKEFKSDSQLQGSQGGTLNTSGGSFSASQNVGQAGVSGTGSSGVSSFEGGSASQGKEGTGSSSGNQLQESQGGTSNTAGGTGQAGGAGFESGNESQGQEGTYNTATGGTDGSHYSGSTGASGATNSVGSVQGGFSGQQGGTHSSSGENTFGATQQVQQFGTGDGTMDNSQKYTPGATGSQTHSVAQGTGPAAGHSEITGNVVQGTHTVTKDQVIQQNTATYGTHNQGQQTGVKKNKTTSNQYDKYTDRGVKGEHFNAYVQGTTVGPLTHPENVGCGVRNADGVGFRITGNSDGESEYGEFPWMVAILKEEKALDQVINVYQCGGSLIHPTVVLTAAHCVQNKQPQDFKIRLGEWDTQTTNEIHDHQDRNVVEIVYHEKFYKGGLFNDVALLFLDKPAEIIETVNTVCLPPQDFNFDLQRCFASGWGKNVFGKDGKYQVILKKIELPVMPYADCQKALRTTRLGARFVLNKSFLCAGGEAGKDTCKGDGGSPLICPIPGSPNRYYQAGIVAWGIGCGETGIPGVYANVAGFRKWIDDHLTQRSISHDYYIYV